MVGARLLVSAMAGTCRDAIVKSATPASDGDLPQSLTPGHLLWMCDRIEQHANDWPDSKLHRWIGFVQGGMIANRMLDLAGARAMFDAAKNAYGASADDPDLIDHLDPESSFKLELGGQG